MFEREQLAILQSRMSEKNQKIQAIIGPRQVGKTRLTEQFMRSTKIPCHYATADLPGVPNTQWLTQQWEIARLKPGSILILDEIQKIPNWSVVVKQLWDEDQRTGKQIKVIILGSSPWLMQQGLNESLTGRFECIPISHWSYIEMQKAFDVTFEEYIYFGGYPGAAMYIKEEPRWRDYILHSLIETTISRDILMMTRIDKPALLRQLFQLGCRYSGQILSYQKMLGQLQDAGNATTLAHYLKLLSAAGLLTGIEKFSESLIRTRASSPKWQVLNNALLSAQSDYTLASAQTDREYWGRLIESAVGAHMINQRDQYHYEVFYWREHNKEIDFVIQKNDKVIGFEVKSGMTKNAIAGASAFREKIKPDRILLIGGSGIPVQEFLSTPIERYFI